MANYWVTISVSAIHFSLVFSVILSRRKSARKNQPCLFWTCRKILSGNDKKQWNSITLQRRKDVQPCEEPKKQALERLMNEYDPIPKEQPKKELQKDIKPLEITVEGLFRIAGILALLAGVVLLFSTAKDRQPVLGFIYLLSGAFSCLGCFWCAKVIKLLSNTVELLTTISKRMYNIDKD